MTHSLAHVSSTANRPLTVQLQKKQQLKHRVKI